MSAKAKESPELPETPHWYQDAILYELPVRAFYDSDGDGVGDFRGLTKQLDYLQDLGVTALRLLPFYPSPLKDDGYDITDYTEVHPLYGTLHDFTILLHEAHKRGLRVITDLVLNHTSDQHPWFQRARRAQAGSPRRAFYVWSETPDKYRDARVIFKDLEASNWTWDPVANAYYWHRFYSHQPDLNYANPHVRKAMLQVVDFWFRLGVDGLHLNAVPYLYEQEGTNCENLSETHAFLKELRRHVDRQFTDRLLLAAANQWPEDAAAYFGDADECHMTFHFPLMPRLFMALRTEDRFPILDILQQTPSIPAACQWGLFLRNHDELTLEMVTDEERDYLYRVYAQDPHARIHSGIRRRLAPLLGNDRRRIELMKGLLFSLPGSPILYYGDEIGMGDNIYLGDRNGVRTPMQWSADFNAGFSHANPQQLYLPLITDPEYHYEAVNVEIQQSNPHSLLWWMKRLIALRKRAKAFGRGTLEFLQPENRKILAFLRRYQDECILVVANLSRFVQWAELDLSTLQGVTPVEMFSQTMSPPIDAHPYRLTLGPHSFYWFALELSQREAALTPATPERQLPTFTVEGAWENVFSGPAKAAVEASLPATLRGRRWFGGKARQLRSAKVVEALPLPAAGAAAALTLIQVEYTEGGAETYVLPLAVAAADRAEQVQKDCPEAVIARLRGEKGQGVLYEALWEPSFCQTLLEAIAHRRRPRGVAGTLRGVRTRMFRTVRGPSEVALTPALVRAEQSNTSVVYGGQLLLKLFRRVAAGVNPDLEIGRFLTEQAAFAHTPPVAGALEYWPDQGEPMTLAVLRGFVPNQGDAWSYTLDSLGQYFVAALARQAEVQAAFTSLKPILALSEEEPPPVVNELIGPYLEATRLLGQRTAELHVALASESADPRFAPEPFSVLYQRARYQALRSLTAQVFQSLRQRLRGLPEAVQGQARHVLSLEAAMQRRVRPLFARPITALRIRCHGNYHLGQMLYTGKDFIITDFEGEPDRPFSGRLLKRSPLRDVAGMLRSFHYAAYASLFDQIAKGFVHSHPDALASLEPWVRVWTRWVSAVFVKTYLHFTSQATFVPRTREECQLLLDAYVLEKAIYELGYELNNRPDWVTIPLHGITQLMEGAG